MRFLSIFCFLLISSCKKDVKKIPKVLSNNFTYNNIDQIVTDTTGIPWLKENNQNISCILHFNLYSKDTLNIEYNPECWGSYPIKITKNRIIVYWNKEIDTKYNFPIVGVINSLDNKHNNHPFLGLNLINRNTLKVEYLNKELIYKLNQSNKGLIIFPNEFKADKDLYQ